MSGGNVLVFAIHNSERWWRAVADALSPFRGVLVSDLRGMGDRDVVDSFYAAYRGFLGGKLSQPMLFAPEEVADMIARCRVLRWLPAAQATAMVQAMGVAMEEVLDALQPVAATSWPIDRYVIDILERLCERRGIPYYELTASAAPGMAMLLHRGRLIERGTRPDPSDVERAVRELADPLFTPAYVQNQAAFKPARWLKIFSYFRLRSAAFKLIGRARRDPLNCHYLDAQSFLGHKPRLADISVTGMFDPEWRTRLASFPVQRRLLIGLQLFPEASIDYWVRDRSLIDYEDVLVEVAEAFSREGFLILVKDHPLQFGFRQRELLHRLRAIPNVVLVPYEVSGNEVLGAVGANFTLTGTLGMQAALRGLTSVVTPTYYTTADDFILFDRRAEIPELPQRVLSHMLSADLVARQRRIVEKLLRGSFPGDFFSFKNFDEERNGAAAAALGRALSGEVTQMGPEGADWHRGNPWLPGRAIACPADLL